MILNYLVEKFLTGDNYRTSYHDGYAEIFTNPTPSEIKDIANAENNEEASVRLAVDKNGTLYAWIYTLLHDDMEGILGKDWVLKLEYNYPDTVAWLGGDSAKKEWKKYGTNNVINKLINAIPSLNVIKYSNINGNAWEK